MVMSGDPRGAPAFIIARPVIRSPGQPVQVARCSASMAVISNVPATIGRSWEKLFEITSERLRINWAALSPATPTRVMNICSLEAAPLTALRSAPNWALFRAWPKSNFVGQLCRRPLSIYPKITVLLCCIGRCLFSIPLPAGAADTVSIIPNADATLFEVKPLNSAGGATFFNAGTTQNGPRDRALLEFDIASAIPAGAQITAVGLQVDVVRQPSDGFAASLFGLHRMLQSW